MRLPGNATARDKRAALYAANSEAFLHQLRAELHKLTLDAKRKQSLPAVRLNGTSDLPWEHRHPDLFEEFPNVQFYDYTKIPGRMLRFLGMGPESSREGWPDNYDLTYSAEQRGMDTSVRILKHGGNVALCFWPKLPKSWWGFPVIDGDLHDARFLDPDGNVIGLLAKGLAQVDVSGFTVRPCPKCNSEGTELLRRSISDGTHRTTLHQCIACGHETSDRLKLAG